MVFFEDRTPALQYFLYIALIVLAGLCVYTRFQLQTLRSDYYKVWHFAAGYGSTDEWMALEQSIANPYSY